MVLEEVCKLADCPPGKLKGVTVNGKKVVLANVDGKICALEGICTHRGGPLAEGVLEGSMLICPYHHAKFDCKTGLVASNLPPEYGQATPLKTYPVKVEGESVLVEMP